MIVAPADSVADELARDIARVGSFSSMPTLLRLITELTGLRLSLIARVTPERWVCCAVNDTMSFGLTVGQELEVATTLCNEVRSSGVPIVIDDVPNDPVYRDHHTPRIYGLKSYIAVPIFRQDGSYFGNVCALDSEPRALKSKRTDELLSLFAQLVSFHLDTESRHDQIARQLDSERVTSELREQFIAVLGHDVRTPLASIVMTGEVLARKPDADVSRLGERIRTSALRVSRLMSDVLDFARGRLGGGIGITRRPVDAKMLLSAVVDEAVASTPERRILLDTHDCASVNVDADRVQQLVTNLLANAVQHGASDAPILVDARMDGRNWIVAVTNEGESIPDAARQRLFEPYVRGTAGGLGLGLYIVSQIMASHGGSVGVHTPTAKRTCFTCTFPNVI